MYRPIKNFRITSLKQDGKNWNCSVYSGKKNIGKASYIDGIYTINIPDKYKTEIMNCLKNKRKMFVDGEPIKWSIELAVMALIENEAEYKMVKEQCETGFLVAKTKDVDIFSVFNVKDTAENRRELSKAYEVDIYGTDFIEQYQQIIQA